MNKSISFQLATDLQSRLAFAVTGMILALGMLLCAPPAGAAPPTPPRVAPGGAAAPRLSAPGSLPGG